MDDSDSDMPYSTCSSDSSGCLDDISTDSEDEVQNAPLENAPVTNVRPIGNVVPVLKTIIGFTICTATYYDTFLHKIPVHTRPFSGWAFLCDLINGRDVRSKANLRMKPEVFLSLCKLLVEDYGLRPLRYVTVEEQVATFMMIVGTQEGNRQIQENLQRSGFTVSKSFHRVLTALTKMSIDWVRPFEDLNETPDYIKENPRYYPHFKDCIGAIDGTHIDAKIRVHKQIPYRGRKGSTTQNCMVACDFDYCFTFVLPGWEGSAHDTRIFYDTIRNPNKGFPMPPKGKYYLVDSGYPNVAGFLAPFKGEHYWQKEFEANPRHKNHYEAFNHVHSSLRSMIECSFGIWKNKFEIMKKMPVNISFKDQVLLVPATMAVHNFIRKHDRYDEDFVEYIRKKGTIPPAEVEGTSRSTSVNIDNDPTMNKIRDDICTSITFARLGVPVNM